MKQATKALAERIAGEPVLSEFLLVGGTALSVYLDRLTHEGCTIEDATPVAARQDAINDGLDIEEYYQDWLVDGVKLTFFTIQECNGRKKLANDRGVRWMENLRLASLDTLFVTKSLVLTDRHTLRDNYDMYTLFVEKQFTYEDFVRAYADNRPGASLEIPKQRLLSTDYPLTDPGLAGLVEESEAEIISRICRYFTAIYQGSA